MKVLKSCLWRLRQNTGPVDDHPLITLGVTGFSRSRTLVRLHDYDEYSFVMPGFMPGIHVFIATKTWIAGTSPAMTRVAGIML
jgi:hypothetical protein